MKNTKLIAITFFAICAIAVVSCKKKKTKTQLLSDIAWKIAEARIQDDSTKQWTSILPLIDACELDNVWTYAAGNTYTITEGATKCNAADPDLVETGTWSFSDGEAKINIQNAGGSVVSGATINTLDENNFKFTTSGTNAVEYTFKH
jgi:Lipocalin-like domain